MTAACGRAAAGPRHRRAPSRHAIRPASTAPAGAARCGSTPRGSPGRPRSRRAGPRWRRTSRGPATSRPSVDADRLEQRIVEAAAVLPEACGGVTGWAALRWAGATLVRRTPRGGGRPAPVDAGGRRHRAIRPQPGIAITRSGSAPATSIVVDGAAVDDPVAVDLLRDALRPRRARRGRRARHGGYDDLVSHRRGRRPTRLAASTAGPGCRSAARRSPLADENAWSPHGGATCAWSGSWTPGCPGRCATARSSTSTAEHLGTPDLLDPRPAWSASTTGRSTCSARQRGKRPRPRGRVPRARPRVRHDGRPATAPIRAASSSGCASAYERAAARPPSRRAVDRSSRRRGGCRHHDRRPRRRALGRATSGLGCCAHRGRRERSVRA